MQIEMRYNFSVYGLFLKLRKGHPVLCTIIICSVPLYAALSNTCYSKHSSSILFRPHYFPLQAVSIYIHSYTFYANLLNPFSVFGKSAFNERCYDFLARHWCLYCHEGFYCLSSWGLCDVN